MLFSSLEKRCTGNEHAEERYLAVLVFFRAQKIENTSWKVLAYGIYARVVDVSEIERVSAANE